MKTRQGGFDLRIALSAAALVISVALDIQAATVVVPNASATVEGDVNNSFPFNNELSRSHQVYGAAEFPPVPILITQLSFRPDFYHGHAFTMTFPDVQINLSTTQAAPDGLSLTFADNVGPDEAIVHSGPLTLSSTFVGPARGPKALDVSVPVSPFLYDSRLGNLLLDVRMLDSIGIQDEALDAVGSNSDNVSRATVLGNSPIASNRDTVAVVVQFTYSRVPEPSTLTLAAAMVFAVIPASRRRTCHHEP